MVKLKKDEAQRQFGVDVAFMRMINDVMNSMASDEVVMLSLMHKAVSIQIIGDKYSDGHEGQPQIIAILHTIWNDWRQLGHHYTDDNISDIRQSYPYEDFRIEVPALQWCKGKPPIKRVQVIKEKQKIRYSDFLHKYIWKYYTAKIIKKMRPLHSSIFRGPELTTHDVMSDRERRYHAEVLDYWAYRTEENCREFVMATFEDLLSKLGSVETLLAEAKGIKSDMEALAHQTRKEAEEVKVMQNELKELLKQNSENTAAILKEMRTKRSLSADDIAAAVRRGNVVD